MTHFVRPFLLAIGIALPMTACGGTTIDERRVDASTGGASGWEHSIPATGAAVGAGGNLAAGGTTVEAGGWVAAGGTINPHVGWPAPGGAYFGSGGNTWAGGTAGVAGAPSAGGCCAAVPTCPPGDLQVASDAPCNVGGCYSVTACCATIWCVPQSCVPSCRPGELLVKGSCVGAGGCRTQTQCGVTFACYWPVDGGAEDAAPPAPVCPPPGVRIYAGPHSACASLDTVCPPYSTQYDGECGCGCGQDASCPASVDCAPKVPAAPQDPLCSDTTKCPYTIRAF
jgi:hypothetical protein